MKGYDVPINDSPERATPEFQAELPRPAQPHDRFAAAFVKIGAFPDTTETDLAARAVPLPRSAAGRSRAVPAPWLIVHISQW